MKRYIEPNEHGGFNVYQSVGAAREHIGTFKRRQDAEQFAAAPELLEALTGLVHTIGDLERDNAVLEDPYGTTYTATQRSGMKAKVMLKARAAILKAGGAK